MVSKREYGDLVKTSYFMWESLKEHKPVSNETLRSVINGVRIRMEMFKGKRLSSVIELYIRDIEKTVILWNYSYRDAMLEVNTLYGLNTNDILDK